MADEEIIIALDRLREHVGQRLRATTGLLSSLKATVATVGRTSRLLVDYATDEPSPTVLQAQQALDALRPRELVAEPLTPELRRELRALTGLATALREALSGLRAEPIDVIRLDRAVTTLQTIKAPPAELTALLPALTAALEEGQRQQAEQFGLALRDRLAVLGLNLVGRPPRFAIGSFELAVDFVRRRATLAYGKEMLAASIPLSLDAVLRAYQTHERTVCGRDEAAERWNEQLLTAWRLARARRGVEGRPPAGQRAGLVDCYLELVLLRQARAFRSAPSKRAFVDYSRAQFARDVMTLLDRQRFKLHGATRSQTDAPERSLWLVDGPGPHDGAYIADLELLTRER